MGQELGGLKPSQVKEIAQEINALSHGKDGSEKQAILEGKLDKLRDDLIKKNVPDVLRSFADIRQTAQGYGLKATVKGLDHIRSTVNPLLPDFEGAAKVIDNLKAQILGKKVAGVSEAQELLSSSGIGTVHDDGHGQRDVSFNDAQAAPAKTDVPGRYT